MKNLLFFFCLLLLPWISGTSQQINFAIQQEGITLNYAKVWVVNQDQKFTYAFQLGALEGFPLEISSITSQFECGNLQSAAVRSTNNQMNIKGDGLFYHIIKDGQYCPQKGSWARTSLAKLFCEKPLAESVFIESEGQMSPLYKLDHNHYQIHLANGADMVFSYEKEVCVSVKISLKGEEWELKRIETFM